MGFSVDSVCKSSACNRTYVSVKHLNPQAQGSHRVRAAYSTKPFSNLPMHALNTVRAHGKIQLRNRPIGPKESATPHHPAQARRNTARAVGMSKPLRQLSFARSRLSFIRGLEKPMNEHSDAPPNLLTRQFSHTAQFADLAFHMHMAPLEVPAPFTSKSNEPRESVSNHGNNTGADMGRKRGKCLCPERPRLASGKDAENSECGARGADWPKRNRETPIRRRMVLRGKPQNIDHGNQGICAVRKRREWMASHPCAETGVKSSPHHFPIRAPYRGDSTKRCSLPQDGICESWTGANTFSATPSRARGPRRTALGTSLSPG